MEIAEVKTVSYITIRNKLMHRTPNWTELREKKIVNLESQWKRSKWKYREKSKNPRQRKKKSKKEKQYDMDVIGKSQEGDNQKRNNI